MLLYGRLNHAVTVGAQATVHCQKPSETHHTTQGGSLRQLTSARRKTIQMYIEWGRQHHAPSYNEHINMTASFGEKIPYFLEILLPSKSCHTFQATLPIEHRI